MKPRPSPAPLTEEDEAIWATLLVASGDGLWFVRLISQATGFGNDRRDADLMYECAVWSDVLNRFVRNRPPAPAPLVDTRSTHIYYYHRFLATGQRPPDITNCA